VFDVPYEVAVEALSRWEGDPASLDHIGTSGNAVYRWMDHGTPRILRLTHPDHRTHAQNEAELAFLHHLDRRGVQVNVPIASREGRDAERVGPYSTCVLSWADGIVVMYGSPHWNETFFREWGRGLGRMHAASQSYAGPPRWDWRDEYLIAGADRLIPPDDREVRTEFEIVLRHFEQVPRTPGHYGMIHADYAPGNFHYVPGRGIIAFDFGNCCDHWFLSDVAISLSVLRRHAERDRYREWLIAGYREHMPLDPEWLPEIDWLLRLRILYVLLSRLAKFGSQPTEAERKTLATLRAAVLQRFTWPFEEET
jgi:amicoumacin kinase